MTIVPIILCGGSGTRLWPLSRELYAKQWLCLLDQESLFQSTVRRSQSISNAVKPIVLCNHESYFIVTEQLLQIEMECDILFEPLARNTGPAIMVATEFAQQKYGDPLLLILPADHLVPDFEAFSKTISAASLHLPPKAILNLGAKPTSPDSSYGYILIENESDEPPFKALGFIEKPNPTKAEALFEEKKSFWNTGIFLAQATTLQAEFSLYASALIENSQRALSCAQPKENFYVLDLAAYKQLPSIAIDHLLMEKTRSQYVYPLNAAWSDVGAWSQLWAIDKKDEHQNATHGDVVIHDTKNCYLRAESRMLAVVGLDNCVVVETKDAVLVAQKEKISEVKALVSRLQNDNRSEIQNHARNLRPWGSFESLETSTRFKVKNITVKPGHKLSLQLHHHRAEHWIIVSGTAKVTLNEQTFILTENQTTFIPIGAQHRVENPGKIPLVMIEVQMGSYLEEDDILRTEDDYGRAESLAEVPLIETA